MNGAANGIWGGICAVPLESNATEGQEGGKHRECSLLALHLKTRQFGWATIPVLHRALAFQT